MAYVRSNITVMRRCKLEPANIESLSLDVRGNNGVYFMICASHDSPGKCKPTVFLSSMATTLELMYNLRREIVVIGDLHFDLCSDHKDIKKCKELCDQFQLTNSVETPTRVTKSIAALLDLILSSHPDHYVKSGPLHLGISDHDLIYTVCKQSLPNPPPKEEVIFRQERIIIPEKLQLKVVKIGQSLGRLGKTKTKRMLRHRYWFP